MRILVSGSTGLIGSALIPALRRDGHEVLRLTRRSTRDSDAVRWDPSAGRIDERGLAALDAVVHLAGENIAEGRWTEAKKARIRQSRVGGTRLLCEALAPSPPKVFVGASAIGYYGDRGDELLTEDSPPGHDFLAETCRGWEQASQPLETAGARVVRVRIGVVLSTRGGALARMLLPFRLGLGGPLGSGRQWMSWITRDDLVRVLQWTLETESLAGAVNATAPEPVRQGDFARTLARVLRRPALLPTPAFAVRTLFGEMGEALLLSSTRVVPQRLREGGFAFEHAELEAALRHVLGAGAPAAG